MHVKDKYSIFITNLGSGVFFFGGARKKRNARLGGQSVSQTFALLYFRVPPKKERLIADYFTTRGEDIMLRNRRSPAEFYINIC